MKKGSKLTEEQRQKNIEAQKKAWANPELRKRHSEIHKGQIAWNKGKKNIYSEETKRKMGKSNLGRTAWNKGSKLTEEQRKRNVEAQKKAWANPELRKKSSESHKILWQRPEYRKRMSESAKTSINPSKFKVGHGFSEGVIGKIRKATLKQYESGSFPKQTDTKPERQIKEELIKRGHKEGIDFIHQYKFMNKFMCDFCFPDKKVVVEVDGDFWHANPKKYPDQTKLHKHQIKDIGRDKSKNAYIAKVDNGSWTMIRLWESDIDKNVIECVDKIEEALKRQI